MSKIFITGTPYSGLNIMETILSKSNKKFTSLSQKFDHKWSFFREEKTKNKTPEGIYLDKKLLPDLPKIQSRFPDAMYIVFIRSPFLLFKYIFEKDHKILINDFIENKFLNNCYESMYDLVLRDKKQETIFIQTENILENPQFFINFINNKLNTKIDAGDPDLLKEIDILSIKNIESKGGQLLIEPLIYSKIKRKWWWIYHIFYKRL